MMATVEKRPTFIHSTSSAYLVTLTLLEMLLFSPTVLSDCDQPCSPSFPMANQCQSVTLDSHCGYIHETSTTPSAPTNLRFRDFSYTFGNKTTLGLNITWQLPENYTGLRGFFVHVMKTSYPVGSQHCKKVAFPELTTALQRPSEVSFSMDCLHNVNVDGKYDITVTSLDSGMSVKKSHHTQNCYERPEVEGCLVVRDCVKDGCRGGVPSSDDWIPPHPKAHAVYEDHMWKVRVEFYVYPGNFWLTYRVNLYVYSNHSGTFTPIFSHHVNSNGSSGPIFHEFWNVTPGKYQARVKINSGDAFQVKSEDVVIMKPTTVSSTVEPTSPTTPPTSHSTNVGEPKSGLNIPIAALAGIGVGVFVAVLLVALLVIWKVKISKREPFSRGGNFTDGVMPYSDETSDPTNNMLHSEADRGAVQGVYPSPYASSPYRMDGGAGEEFGCGDSCVCDNDLRIHKVDFSKLDLIDLNHADLGSVAPSGITV